MNIFCVAAPPRFFVSSYLPNSLSQTKQSKTKVKIKTNEKKAKQETIIQKKQNKTKVLSCYFWTFGLHWSMVIILGNTLLEKVDFPFPTRYQMFISSCLAVGLCLLHLFNAVNFRHNRTDITMNAKIILKENVRMNDTGYYCTH